MFTEVAEKAGVAGSGKAWGSGCAFVDYDRDGFLDLIVANYVDFDLSTTPAPGERTSCIWKGTPVMCGPRGLPAAKNILYRNRGNGTFDDVTIKAHIDQTNAHYALSVSTLDFDDDGWPDIYIACDSTPSILYHNNRDGTFTDVAVTAGAAFNEDGREQAGMGTTIADYDGDGRLDIFKTNFSDDTSTLYRNNGDGTFTDATFAAGLGLHTKYLGWGTMFFDFDNDGWPDSDSGQRTRLSRGRQISPRQQLSGASNPLSQQRQRHIHRHFRLGGRRHHNRIVVPRPRRRRPLERWPHFRSRKQHERPAQPAGESGPLSKSLDRIQDGRNRLQPRRNRCAHHGQARASESWSTKSAADRATSPTTTCACTSGWRCN